MSNRIAAILLGVGSLVTILAISMHPVVRARKPAELLQGVVAIGPMDRAVHATVIVILFALIFALATYTVGRLRGATVAAFIAYAAGAGSLLVATLIDGFFTPAFAHAASSWGAPGQSAAIAVLVAGAVAIQVGSKCGFIAMGVATVLWSADLVPERELRTRIIGIGGVVAGVAVCTITLVTARFNPHSLMVVVGVQALWYLAIARLLYERSE